jgi:hypothetical protein
VAGFGRSHYNAATIAGGVPGGGNIILIGEEGIMLQSLALAAVVVIVLWVIILGLYLLIARRQPDVAAQMKALDEQLSRAEQEGGQK